LRDVQARAESHFAALLDSKETRLRSPDRDNLRRYADSNAKVQSAVVGRARVVFLGDSITDSWRLNEYFPDRDFINRGISGQITGELLGRMKADVIDLKPAAVLVLAGTNDLARGVPVETIQSNLWMIANLAAANGIKPLLAGILPVSDYHKSQNPAFEQTTRRPPEKIRAINAWLSGFCRQRGFTYVNYYDSLVDSSGFLKAELANDGLHPNSDGYRIMAPIAQEAIERMVPAAQDKKRRKR
jgi:lysophospholipase L1-like esterase